MLPRSLMVPPGVPDFMTRERHLEPGPVTLTGRAWSGHGADRAGRGVHRRRRDASPTPRSTRRSARTPGAAGASTGTRRPASTSSRSRATDAAGNTQPLEVPWNLKGYANNAVERIRVVVSAA